MICTHLSVKTFPQVVSIASKFISWFPSYQSWTTNIFFSLRLGKEKTTKAPKRQDPAENYNKVGVGGFGCQQCLRERPEYLFHRKLQKQKLVKWVNSQPEDCRDPIDRESLKCTMANSHFNSASYSLLFVRFLWGVAILMLDNHPGHKTSDQTCTPCAFPKTHPNFTTQQTTNPLIAKSQLCMLMFYACLKIRQRQKKTSLSYF